MNQHTTRADVPEAKGKTLEEIEHELTSVRGRFSSEQHRIHGLLARSSSLGLRRLMGRQCWHRGRRSGLGMQAGKSQEQEQAQLRSTDESAGGAAIRGALTRLGRGRRVRRSVLRSLPLCEANKAHILCRLTEGALSTLDKKRARGLKPGKRGLPAKDHTVIARCVPSWTFGPDYGNTKKGSG